MTPELGAREQAATCWCGGALGSAIGAHYRLCVVCGAAVLALQPGPRHFDVADDDRDFYGRAYWTEYSEARSFPAIGARARWDLSERCVFWLERVLEVTHPPGRALEIGCGHGGFVRLLQELGFEAAGTELSPWVVDFAKRTFGVPVLLGRLDVLPLQSGFKCIAAFDVLEHLKDPLETVQRCAGLLAPDGVLLLQTPCYRGEGPEWSMFQENEHIHLFTEESMRLLLGRAGFKDVRVERSLFPYDMWVVAALGALPVAAPGADGGWHPPAAFRALLDIAVAARDIRETLRVTEADSGARLVQVEELTRLLGQSDTDRAARLAQVEELKGLLRESDTDRAARLAQVRELDRLLREAEIDRAARLAQAAELGGLLRESETDRAARLAQVRELDRLLREAEIDRAARLAQAAELGGLLRESETDRAARLAQVRELDRLLREAEIDRAARLAQAEELGRLLRESDVDRAARLEQIEELTGWLRESEADRAARGHVIEALEAKLDAIEQTAAWRLYTSVASRLNRRRSP